ncbi:MULTISPECIES: hypothetical protein [Leucobacter]|nr:MULTISPECIES: hypothetical protein [Leucobacter]UTX52139.1 hypothetical protein KI794_10225 [Leucobacter aridicollis]
MSLIKSISSVAVAGIALSTAFLASTAATADMRTEPVKQFAGQEQRGLGLGSETSFTIEASAHNSDTSVVDTWKITDELDSRISDVQAVTMEVINPADPLHPTPLPFVDEESNAGYRWERTGNTISAWITPTGLRDFVNLPGMMPRDMQVIRVTVDASVSAVGDGIIKNTSTLEYATTAWANDTACAVKHDVCSPSG